MEYLIIQECNCDLVMGWNEMIINPAKTTLSKITCIII